MLLCELDSSPLRTRLIAVTAQLRSRIEKDSKRKDWRPWSKLRLQHWLAKHDIILDDSDLFDMVKKAPLNKIIANINDKEVTFVGIGGADETPQTEKTKKKKQDTVAQMAKSAQTLPQTGPATPPLPEPAVQPPQQTPPLPPM